MANSPKGIVDYTNKLNETFAKQEAVAPVFDATATYAVGDSVMYNGKLYTFNTAHSAGAWDSTEVDEDSVQDDVDSIVDTVRANGAHNLLPILASDVKSLNRSGTWTGNVYTVDSMSYTLTVDDDGYVTQVLVNGSINATVSFHLREADNSSFSGMTLSGCPSGGSDSSYYLWIYPYGDTSTFYAKDTGNGDTIATLPTTNTRVSIRIIGGTTVSNAVFKPMIRQASDMDKTYSPYAPTNRDLEINKVSHNAVSTQAVETLGSEALAAHDKLDLFLASNGNMYEATSDISAGDTITSGGNCAQTSVFESLKNKAGLYGEAIRPNSSSVFNLDGFTGILVTTHNSNANLGYVAVVRAAGFLKEIVPSTAISASISNSVLTISNSSTATASAEFIVLNGTISAATT